MKKKIIIGISVFTLLMCAGAGAVAYNSGYCLKNGCGCHQYCPQNSWSGYCVCGHSKAAHQ